MVLSLERYSGLQYCLFLCGEEIRSVYLVIVMYNREERKEGFLIERRLVVQDLRRRRFGNSIVSIFLDSFVLMFLKLVKIQSYLYIECKIIMCFYVLRIYNYGKVILFFFCLFVVCAFFFFACFERRYMCFWGLQVRIMIKL